MDDPPNRPDKSIVLVGLMGVGKSTVGRRLAKKLTLGFVDADEEIERAAGLKVAEIFERHGEAHFRDGERRVIARLLAGSPGVLATGGGAFIEPRTRGEIKAHGTSVWLRAELGLLWDRVRDRPGRPLLQAPDPRAVLADLDRRRAPVYAEADVVVDSRRSASHEAMAKAIVAAVQEHDRRHPDRPPTLERVER
jgi:shikimate kinase